jgi:hypothetical protein
VKAWALRVAAVGAALIVTSSASAEDQAVPSANQPSAMPPPSAPAQSEKTLLDTTLYNTSVGKNLIDKGFDFGGWVEASWTHSFSNPPSNFIVGRVFDVDNDDPTLNQAVIYAQRAIQPLSDRFDIGFRTELLYGGDARFIHSNGLNSYGGDSPQAFPDEQFDLTQAYLQFNVPIGKGLLITAGKFVTLIGYEVINPNGDPLYSHSYLFGYAIPFTHTGVLAAYNITDNITVTGGITRGWEQSLKDNNDSIDGIGQIKWVATDKLTLFLMGVTGPERNKNDSDYRSLIDACLNYAATDKLSLGLNGDYGFEPGAAADGGYATWYGAAGYLGYKFNDYVTANARGEYFSDPDGARGFDTQVYEATFGATITPLPNNGVAKTLKFRPEIRYDYAGDAIFDAGTQHDQWTFAVDALWTF